MLYIEEEPMEHSGTGGTLAATGKLVFAHRTRGGGGGGRIDESYTNFPV